MDSGLSLMLPLLFLTAVAAWWIIIEARSQTRARNEWADEWADALIEAEERRQILADAVGRVAYPDTEPEPGVYDWATE